MIVRNIMRVNILATLCVWRYVPGIRHCATDIRHVATGMLHDPLPYTKIVPMMQCAMGTIFVAMHVCCTYSRYSHSVVAFLLPRHSSCAQYSLPSRAECRQVTPCRASSASGTKAGITSKTIFKLRALSFCFCPKAHSGQRLEARYRRKRPF